MPSPPRYKPSSRGAEVSDAQVSLDWAYRSGEYDRVKFIRAILLKHGDTNE